MIRVTPSRNKLNSRITRLPLERQTDRDVRLALPGPSNRDREWKAIWKIARRFHEDVVLHPKHDAIPRARSSATAGAWAPVLSVLALRCEMVRLDLGVVAEGIII